MMGTLDSIKRHSKELRLYETNSWECERNERISMIQGWKYPYVTKSCKSS